MTHNETRRDVPELSESHVVAAITMAERIINSAPADVAEAYGRDVRTLMATPCDEDASDLRLVARISFHFAAMAL